MALERTSVDLAALRVRAEQWIADDPDPETQEELRALLAAPDLETTDLADRVDGLLEFGTAGLRGVMGAGPNRMNRAVVARATWGLAQELRASVPDAMERAVIVGGDARRLSAALAEDVAAILAGAGFRVLLFRQPVPTPLIGFVVKRRGAAAGVVITASHNPPEYNGYKVYWENAAQIVAPVDARIAAAIERAPAARAIARPDLSAFCESGRLTFDTEDIERAYLQAIRGLAVHPTEGDRSLRIVYTPLHGVGDALMRRALSDAGFTSVFSVPAQAKPDGAFPTVAFPNPEEAGAMDLAFALAADKSADLVLANDPDADRLAVAVPDGPDGAPRAYSQLTGNQVGALLGHYLLTEKPPAKTGRTRVRAVVSSIVSSPLMGRIARDLGAHYEETLTGFKWIANRSIELEREGYAFVFGYEEALGYCVGSAVRDKDGISAGVLMAELTAVLKSRGLTVSDALDAIARRWGVFVSAQVSVTRKGAAGAAAIQAMMDALRAHPPDRIGEDDVIAVVDYWTRWRTPRGDAHGDVQDASERPTPLTLPASHVIAFELASGSRIVARPSGTEPKAKFYFDVCAEVRSPDGNAGAGAGDGTQAPDRRPGHRGRGRGRQDVAEATVRANAAMERLRAAFAGICQGLA